VACALFRDSVASAIASGLSSADSTYITPFGLTYMDSPATTSAVTYKIRVGPAASTIRLNGHTSSRFHGGTQRATLVLQEIKV
jgi:hypothetical protein